VSRAVRGRLPGIGTSGRFELVRRLAIVLWWMGALMFVFGCGLGINYSVNSLSCKKVLAEQAKYDEQVEFANRLASEKALEKADADAKAQGKKLDDIERALVAATARADPNDKAAPIDPVRPGLAAEVSACSESSSIPVIFAGIIGALALPFFALAFVLGGSFLRPPKAG